MEEPAFDIFSGMSRRHARWIEAVHGLSDARERMWQIAEESPGCYFIYSEALISTALGLCVAVPALWAYNYFVGALETFDLETSNFANGLANRLMLELASHRQSDHPAD